MYPDTYKEHKMKTLRVKMQFDLSNDELQVLRNKHGESFKAMVEGVNSDIHTWFFDEYLEWLRAEQTNEGEE